MQVLSALVFTMAAMLLLSTAFKASPVVTMGDDESSVEDLRGLAAEQNKEFKRICGLSYYCQRFAVKRNVVQFSSFFQIY